MYFFCFQKVLQAQNPAAETAYSSLTWITKPLYISRCLKFWKSFPKLQGLSYLKYVYQLPIRNCKGKKSTTKSKNVTN